MDVAHGIGPGQQVPGHVAQPSGGVDQVRGPTERGDLRQNAVDGGLQGELQRVEVSCRGEGPGVLEGQDVRVVPVQAGVPEGQRGVHRGLLDEGQQRRRDELTHVGRRGPESHSGGEVAGADQGEQSRGDGLGDVACRLAGRHVQASWSTTLLSAYVVATLASVALLAEAMLLFIAAVVGWLASLRSTEAACSCRRRRPGGRPGRTGWPWRRGPGSDSC